MTRLLPALLAGCLLLLAGCEPAETGTSDGSAAPLPAGSGFDFYVLALSWSPSYCAAEGEDANRQQCEARRRYRFIVHGLWPQWERGYPQDCPTDRPEVPSALARTLYDIMPSAGLIRHQWRKHGSCTGLTQEDYFQVLRSAWDAVAVPDRFAAAAAAQRLDPDEAEAAFLDANAGLPASGIAVTCDGKYLREVRICMTRELRFRSCPEVDERACRAAAVEMPAPR